MVNTASIEDKSSADLKEMLMQTSVADSGEEKREEAESVSETEETEAVETTPEETEESETEKEVPAKEEAEVKYKLKVEGKEEELPLQKIIEYAQKGRYLERERAKDKAARKAVEEAAPARAAPADISQLNDWFIKEAQTNPVGAIFSALDMGMKNREEQTRSEKAKDATFELEMEEQYGDSWKYIEPRYKKFRDLGKARDTAEAMALSDFRGELLDVAMQKGMEKGSKKAKNRLKAEMPVGEKRTKGSTESPSPDQVQSEKWTSAQIAKHLKRFNNPGY